MYILFMTTLDKLINDDLVLRSQWNEVASDTESAYKHANNLFSSNIETREKVITTFSNLKVGEISNFIIGKWNLKNVWLQIQVVRVK